MNDSLLNNSNAAYLFQDIQRVLDGMRTLSLMPKVDPRHRCPDFGEIRNEPLSPGLPGEFVGYGCTRKGGCDRG